MDIYMGGYEMKKGNGKVSDRRVNSVSSHPLEIQCPKVS